MGRLGQEEEEQQVQLQEHHLYKVSLQLFYVEVENLAQGFWVLGGRWASCACVFGGRRVLGGRHDAESVVPKDPQYTIINIQSHTIP